MLRLILLTIMGLFGVLAVYGTPEMAGGDTLPASVDAAPEVLQQVAYRREPASEPRPVDPGALLRVALAATVVQAQVFEGPRLIPSPEHVGRQNAVAANAGTSLYVAGSRVNLRAAPTPSGSVVASLGQGTAVAPIGPTAGGWIEVAVGSQRGFVSARYLSAKQPG